MLQSDGSCRISADQRALFVKAWSRRPLSQERKFSRNPAHDRRNDEFSISTQQPAVTINAKPTADIHGTRLLNRSNTHREPETGARPPRSLCILLKRSLTGDSVTRLINCCTVSGPLSAVLLRPNAAVQVRYAVGAASPATACYVSVSQATPLAQGQKL